MPAPLLDRLFEAPAAEWEADLAWPAGLPRGLAGTAYWIGPGRFARGSLRYRHWLDGDGLVFALRFDGGAVHARARFVRGTKFSEEERAGHAVYRTFGTRFPGDRLKHGIGLESPVNVSACVFGGHLLAFGEQGLPWALDPVSLETRGLHTFAGQVNEVTPFAAHAKIDPDTGELLNFGVSFAADRPTLHLFRFDRDGTLRARHRMALPYPCTLHDFAISPSYCVFHVSPYLVDVGKLIGEGLTLMESLSWQPERGSNLIVVDRATGALAARVPCGRGYCLHLVNAFERDGRLVVDLVEYERPVYDQYEVIPDLFTGVSCAVPVRLGLDVAAQSIVTRQELDYRKAPDFPAHLAEETGRPYGDVWMLGIGRTGRAGRKFFDELVHASFDTGHVALSPAGPDRCFGGEPLVVTDPTVPDRRLVLCHRHDLASGESAVVAFDGARVEDGPIAEMPLPRPIPALFHGSFAPGASGRGAGA